MSDLNVYSTTAAVNALNSIDGDMVVDTEASAVKVYCNGAWKVFNDDYVFTNRWAMDCSASGSRKLKIAGTSDIILQDSFTIATWFKTPSSITSWSGLINWGDDSPRKGRGIGFNGQNALHFNGWGSHYTLSGATTLSGNTWYHGVAVVSAIASNGDATATIYINGQQDSVTTAMLETFTLSQYNHHEMGGGAYPNSNYEFNGIIDEVAIFNTELSAPDVAAMYNGTAPNGKPVDLTLASSYDTDRTSNLKGYWRMGDAHNDSPVDGQTITGVTNSANPGTNDATTVASSQPAFLALASSDKIYV